MIRSVWPYTSELANMRAMRHRTTLLSSDLGSDSLSAEGTKPTGPNFLLGQGGRLHVGLAYMHVSTEQPRCIQSQSPNIRMHSPLPTPWSRPSIPGPSLQSGTSLDAANDDFGAVRMPANAISFDKLQKRRPSGLLEIRYIDRKVCPPEAFESMPPQAVLAELEKFGLVTVDSSLDPTKCDEVIASQRL